MRHLDLFSGIGGFALAAKWTWGDEYENVGHSEVEAYPCKVYHRHFPESECLGDITKIEWKEGQADIITGGFPCQPHSVAGGRNASEDERDLWGECVRALCTIRPRYALFENVPGLLTSERGRFFNRVLADLAASGYDAEWQTISACAVGAPHTRERVWIFANSDQNGRIANIGLAGWIPQDKVPQLWKSYRTTDKRVWLTKYAGLYRDDDGIPGGLERVGPLGNAIVPQVAQVIFEAIKRFDNETPLP